ncbi:MAG: hypothetical protein SH847_21630 [Roseiflexaceae bacterium]|nr:hypothetical protein [Roseiflexaceae bacterium]
MTSFRIARALFATDSINIQRDSLLRGMIVVPLGLAIAIRWIFPAAIPQASAIIGFDLNAIYDQVFGYILLIMPPAICGILVGFLLLDQRDEQSLRALQVTPLPLSGYLAYRLAAPMLISVFMTIIALPLAGVAVFDLPKLLLVALLAAPLAPQIALFLGAFAANKVQGFALQKALSVIMIIPLLGWFLPMPWQIIAMCMPTFWPAAVWRELLHSGIINWGLCALGLIFQMALTWLLLRQMIARMQR